MKNKLKSVLNKLKELNLDYKLVPSEDFDDLVLYPDNYEEDDVYFLYCRFFSDSDFEYLCDNSNGNTYLDYTEDEFLTFVKNFRA